MSLNINGKQVGRKELLIVITCLLIVIGGIVSAVVVYNDKQARVNAVAEQVTAEQEQRMKQAHAAQAAKEAQRQADMTKLLSICMASQERFDKLTVKQQAAETRPDCAVSVQ